MRKQGPSSKSSLQSGFVALITVLILSAVLLVAVLSLGQYGITARYSLLDLEHKTKSEAYANACLGVARIAIVNDPAYAESNKTIAVGDGSCTIVSVASGVVKVRSVVKDATTNYEVVVNTATGNITSFFEKVKH
jgi:hypothetical protein